MNLELYKIFYIVANNKNITKASEELNISQPAVTKHIKTLEEQLGTPLFIRTKKGVVLNEYGEKIYLKVKHALILLDEAQKEISEHKTMNKGTIRIGISTSLTRKFLLNHIEKFHELYPNIVIDIITDPTKNLITQLKNGVIDIIISKFPDDRDMDLEYIKLGETKYIFAANEKYKYLLNRKLDIKELEKFPILLQKRPSNSRKSADKYFKNNNVKIEPKMNIGSSNLLIDFLCIGYGIGYVTKLYVNEELKNHKLYELDLKQDTEYIPYGMILLKNNIFPSYCNKLVEYLKLNK